MVRIEDSTSESSDLSDSFSESSAYSENNNTMTPSSSSEDDRYVTKGPWSDGGRDGCQCSYDYRGELCEIFCPRCGQEVIETYSNDEDDDWFGYQQPTIVIFPITTPVKPPRKNAPRESDDSFDSWPSADEEEVLNNDGQMERFRLAQVVKDDLKKLTGYATVDDEDYDGDVDEPKVEKKQPRKRRPRKLASDGNEADNEEE